MSEGVYQYTLDNGLNVVIHRLERARLVRVSILHRAGPALEDPQHPGVSLLLLGLMRSSSPGYPNGESSRQLRLSSCSQWSSRSPDCIEFAALTFPAFLPDVLSIQADRLRGLSATPVEVARVQEKLIDDPPWPHDAGPGSRLEALLFRSAYAGSAYGAAPQLSDSSLAKLSPSDVEAFHAATFAPGNAVLVLEGPLDPLAALELVQRAFEGVPRGPEVALPRPPTPASVLPEPSVRGCRGFRGYWIGLGFRLPCSTPREVALVSVATELLGAITQDVRVRQVSGEAFVTLARHRWYPPGMGAGRNARPDSVLIDEWDTWIRGTKRALGPGLRHALLEVARRDARSRMVGAQESQRGLVRGAQALLLNGTAVLPWNSTDSVLASLDLELARDWLTRAFAASAPTRAALHGCDFPALDKTAPDEGGPALDEHFQIKGTTPLLTAAEAHSALAAYRGEPIVQIERARLRGGAPTYLLRVPHDFRVALYGRRELATRGLRTGDVPLNALLRAYSWVDVMADDLAGRDERLQYDLHVTAEAEGFSYRATVPQNELAQMASSLAQRMSPDDFRNLRALNSRPVSADTTLAEPRWLYAQWLRWRMILGEDHPALAGYWDTQRRPMRFRGAQLREVQQRMERAADLHLLAAGDLTAAQFVEAVDRDLGRQAGGRGHAALCAFTCRLQHIDGVIVPNPDRHRCVVAVTMPPCAMAEGAPLDWATAVLALGLIEQSYPLALEAWANRAGCTRVTELVTDCAPELVHQTLVALRGQVRAVLSAAPDDGELARARLALCARIARESNSSESAVSLLREIADYGLPPSDPINAVLGVEASAVATALHAMLDADLFAFSVEGPLTREALESLRP